MVDLTAGSVAVEFEGLDSVLVAATAEEDKAVGW